MISPVTGHYSLTELAQLAGVTPRTIRYYIQQGLLPAPQSAGPQTRYGADHLARLQLIRQLQRRHLPLAEIRKRLAAVDEAGVRQMLDEAAEDESGSALDYIGSVLGGRHVGDISARGPAPVRFAVHASLDPAAHRLTAPAERGPAASELVAARSQWDRIVVHPDIEFHIRRPLSRPVNRQVDRLLALARKLLEEDQP